MAGVEYVAGQELAFSCDYLIPVSLTAWWFPRRWMIAMCVASGVAALVVGKLDGYEYSSPAIGTRSPAVFSSENGASPW